MLFIVFRLTLLLLYVFLDKDDEVESLNRVILEISCTMAGCYLRRPTVACYYAVAVGVQRSKVGFRVPLLLTPVTARVCGRGWMDSRHCCLDGCDENETTDRPFEYL